MSGDIAELIARTLENAVRAPYYQKTIGARWREVTSLEAMASLPLLDKPTAIAHQKELVAGPRPPGFGIASSGTTRGRDLPPLNVLRSREEIDALSGEGSAADEGDPHPGWTLVAVGVHHGLPMDAPRKDELRVPWSYHRNALSMIEAVLSEPQPDGRRVTAMRISAGALKTLTVWLLERGRDPAELGVRLIGTNGARVSPHWRGLIEKSFGATLYDNFSLSEVPTPATECKACSGLHFGWPPLLYEVLDLATGKPKERGPGRLVVTTLFPWVRTMPLLRYDTGDVVHLGDICAAAGEPSVRWLGRLRRGVVLPSGDFVLAPAAVQDVLEQRADTERNPHPAVTTNLVRSRELGLPRWTVSLEDDRRATLRFEVRFDPRVHASAARWAELEVQANLQEEDAGLRVALAKGRAELSIIASPPGSLEPPGDKFE